MIRLTDGTEWNDHDKYAQFAARHGCTRTQAKSYMLIQNYSQTMSLSELYHAARAPGKGAQLADEIIQACNDLPRGSVFYMGRGRGMSKSVLPEAQARFLTQKPLHLIGSGRPRMLPQQRIVWDEMGLFAKDWYRIDENGVVWNMGIDWGADVPNIGYAVVRRITRNVISLELKDAEDQTPRLQPPVWSTGRMGPRASTAAARRNRARRAELLLHRWGCDVAELLRGIRAREAQP